MKKTKFIALVLVAALMMAGAGYAAWTDQLTITTTVDTGELDIAFGEGEGFFGDVWSNPNLLIWDGLTQKWVDARVGDYLDKDVEFAKKDFDLNDENDWLKFTFSNMYPGTQARGKYNMKNVGTIPATIDDVRVTINTTDTGNNDTAELAAAMMIRDTTFILKNNGVEIDRLTVDDIPLAGLDAELKSFFVGKTLNPNDEALLGGGIDDYFIFEVPTTLNNSEGELETVEITIDFDFVQHNMYNPAQ